ncbi:MAG: enterochelin esterase [Tessaracoccus sp.]|uniref:enterochelin esterase n=1 Tax=Tessaracoccus sp. TaxID=1971211 RepID=UPI001EB6ABD2|nr:enterochelin esterase [Tessaracoccus sp.]MBK7819842.1 enterochelin esterase [Tessaracoccus sp.]
MRVAPRPPKVPRPETAPLAEGGVPRALALRLDVVGGPTTAAGREVLADFWAHAVSPVLAPDEDGSVLVTFLWRDADADRVLLFVNRLTDERDLSSSWMRRVEGTDVWHLTYRMAPDWRASYAFLPQADSLDEADLPGIRQALDHGLADPLNPETCRNRGGTVMSVVALSEAPAQPWAARREDVAERGDVTCAEGPNGRRVWTYVPPGAPADEPLPVVLLLDGEVWVSSLDLATTMDNLLADGAVRPAYLVMLDSGGPATRRDEMTRPDEVAAFVALELLPWARARRPISDRREDVLVSGVSLGGLVALWTAIAHADVVGGAIAHSPSLWVDDLSTLLDGADLGGTRIHQEVGTREWVLLAPNRELAGRLARAGADTTFVEYNGGHDYACWRGGVADGLANLLAPHDSGPIPPKGRP